MTCRKGFGAALVLVAAIPWANGAQAQIDSQGWVMITSTVTHSDPLSMMLDDRMAQDAARAREAWKSRAAANTSLRAIPADTAALRYLPSKARRSANLAAFVQKTRAADPAAAADLQKLFAQGDFIERIGALVAPHGLHIDNVADAYAMWWLTAWGAVHGDNDTPDPATLAAVRRQAASAVAATRDIAGASDAKKQELAEALWVQSALIDAAVEQAKRDPAQLRALGEAVRKGARGMGLDLDRLDLTSTGFVLASAG